MIATLINLIIVLLVVGVLFWAIQRLIGVIPLPEPIRTVVYVLCVVVLVLIVVFYAIIPLVNGLAHMPLLR